MEFPLRRPVILPLRHYVLIGIGNWGWTTLAALAHALGSAHPELVDANEWIHLSPDGWCWFSWLPYSAPFERHGSATSLSSEPQAAVPASWFEEISEHAEQTLASVFENAANQSKVGRLRRLGYEPVTGEQGNLDVYLIGRLDDPFVQSVLPGAIELLRRLRGGRRFTLGLFLGADSPQWVRLPTPDKQALRTFMEQLDRLLAHERERVDASEDGIGWCYLIDTLDEYGRSLGCHSGEGRHGSDAGLLLAEVLAGFLALLIGSDLRECRDYRSFQLPALTRWGNRQGIRSYCSTFSCAAVVLPIQETTTRRLSVDLLQQFDPRRPPDQDRANSLVREFFVKYKLRRPDLEMRLNQDETGQPIRFTLDPSRLDGVSDEELVDRILSWDALIAQNKMRWIAEQMESEAQEIVREAQLYLHDVLDDLVTHSLNGVATAHLFCDRLRQAVTHEEQSAMQAGQERRGCLRALFGLSLSPRREPMTFPDLQPLQHALQRALGERVERLAVWVRYIYLALFETIFVLAAWGHLRSALKFSSGNVLGLPPASPDLWIFPLAILVINILTAWLTILQNERRILKARDQLIQAIQQKYTAIVRWNISQYTTQIYRQLLAALEREQAALARWDRVVAEAIEDLLSNPATYRPLCLEDVLSEHSGYAGPVATYSENEIKYLFEKWLRTGNIPAWREADRNAMRRAACEFAHQQVLGRGMGLSIESYAEPRRDQHALATLVTRLQETRPQLFLGNLSAYRRHHFLGVYDSSVTQADRWIREREWTTLISTADAERIVFAPTVHGLPLRELPIWGNLQ